MPPRFARVSDYDGSLTFCRLMYRSVRRHERGLGWSTDYPNAELNFSIRLSELTKTRVSRTRQSAEPLRRPAPPTSVCSSARS